jgi:hypothetical protein
MWKILQGSKIIDLVLCTRAGYQMYFRFELMALWWPANKHYMYSALYTIGPR